MTTATPPEPPQAIDIFPWNDNFATGLTVIDAQHRKLVSLLNILASHVAFRSSLTSLAEVFDALADYTVYHFQTEETIWRQYLPDDPDEIAHRAIHQSFIDEVTQLKRAAETRPLAEVAESALGFLARWLASHILETDRFMAYTVQALDEGLDLAAAKQHAQVRMGGATRALIDIILSIYATLSTNTLRLMRELAEHRQATEQLNRAREEADTANRAKSQFLATMSHEIRTPMNGILGMAQLLLMPDVSAEDRVDFARTILNSGQTLLVLLNDILDLSKVEAGKLTLETSSVTPAQLLREVNALFAEAAHQKGLELAAVWLGTPADHYLGDSHRLRQMLSNFIGNALKFTASGRVDIRAEELSRNDTTALLEFSVTDTGIGISPEARELLFKPFSQADSSTTRQFGGTGLGLSIVRRLAELMHGEAGVESTPGAGARFWFRIRLALQDLDQERRQANRTPTRTEPRETASGLTGRVLVVEDNGTNRKVIEALLLKLNLTVVAVENGQQGVTEIIRPDAETFDIVLMDIHMPVMDGYAATQAIRQWERDYQQTHLPIIALTADAFDEDRQRCEAAGMDDFLAKPVSFTALQTTLGHWLGRSKVGAGAGRIDFLSGG